MGRKRKKVGASFMMSSLDYTTRQYMSDIGFKREVTLIENADILVIPGGSDVNPRLYNQEPHVLCGKANDSLDKAEKTLFNKAVKLDIPILGICRGAQMACILSGGELYQHVTGHLGKHFMYTDNNITKRQIKHSRTVSPVTVTSCHHQMMMPFKMNAADYQLLGWSLGLSREYLNDSGKVFLNKTLYPKAYTRYDSLKEPEIIYFPKTRALALQYHPEFSGMSTLASDYTEILINSLLYDNKSLVEGKTF